MVDDGRGLADGDGLGRLVAGVAGGLGDGAAAAAVGVEVGVGKGLFAGLAAAVGLGGALALAGRVVGGGRGARGRGGVVEVFGLGGHDGGVCGVVWCGGGEEVEVGRMRRGDEGI